MEPKFSDHSLLKIDLQGRQDHAARPFRFLNCLVEHEKFLPLVDANWATPTHLAFMQRVWTKLKKVKLGLKSLYSEHFQGSTEKLMEIRGKLQVVQEDMGHHLLNDDLIVEEKDLKNQLDKWGKIAEIIYRQKSRVKWLQIGDSNTAYFFASMKHRYSQNHITSLTDDYGTQLQHPEAITAEVVRFYKGLLGHSGGGKPAVNPSIAQQRELIKLMNSEEVFQALNDIDSFKAPGCDGLNAYFFLKAWPIVESEVTSASGIL
ncbi:uncharacterized protein LOC132066426 [Lycium ferocissimum]|uniref:uncharacterized protein LOC132066426 n=1 Tax=Lycium ferocissimum TaxID=112874 RepID=UPI00281521A6|nr:uncharacterized protein LOC132066426 [Lycium ferocissimum]